MKYILLIYSDEKGEANLSKEEMDAWMGEYWAYTDAMQKAGVRLSGSALQPTATATTVRMREGKIITTDGPFAETKEQLGGYYLVECENLDQAIEWAARCPTARNGSMEVRPVMEFAEFE